MTSPAEAKSSSILLYHGTSESNWPSIQQRGIREGSSFASDPAFAALWAIDRFGEEHAIVIEVEVPEAQVNSLSEGTRAFPVRCTQWTIPNGTTIGPKGLRKCGDEEMKPHITYAKEQADKARGRRTNL